MECGDFVVLEPDELNVGKVANLFGHSDDFVVGCVDFGDGETLPPILVFKVDFIDVEQFFWDLLDILSNEVEASCL